MTKGGFAMCCRKCGAGSIPCACSKKSKGEKVARWYREKFYPVDGTVINVLENMSDVEFDRLFNGVEASTVSPSKSQKCQECNHEKRLHNEINGFIVCGGLVHAENLWGCGTCKCEEFKKGGRG